MSQKERFNKVKEEHLKTLKQFVPIVARVHGGTHPEFHEVHKYFDDLDKKIEEAGSNKPQLEEVFSNLRKVTENYTIPADVCESYEAVYNMLGEMDKAYHL